MSDREFILLSKNEQRSLTYDSGPFPTEQLNELGEKLQSVGHEVGVTTGRKRRCGWLDLVVVKHSHACNDYTAINLTKLDVLDDFDELKVATSYSYNGEVLEGFPANIEILGQVEVQYDTLPGWKKPTTGVTSYYDLPVQARNYIEYIEKFVGVKAKPTTSKGRYLKKINLAATMSPGVLLDELAYV